MLSWGERWEWSDLPWLRHRMTPMMAMTLVKICPEHLSSTVDSVWQGWKGHTMTLDPQNLKNRFLHSFFTRLLSVGFFRCVLCVSVHRFFFHSSSRGNLRSFCSGRALHEGTSTAAKVHDACMHRACTTWSYTLSPFIYFFSFTKYTPDFYEISKN